MELLVIRMEKEKDELGMQYEDKYASLHNGYEKQLAVYLSEFTEKMENMKNESLEGLSIAYQDIDRAKKSLEIKMRKEQDVLLQEIGKAHEIELRRAGNEIFNLRQELHFLRSKIKDQNKKEETAIGTRHNISFDKNSEGQQVDVDDPISPPRKESTYRIVNGHHKGENDSRSESLHKGLYLNNNEPEIPNADIPVFNANLGIQQPHLYTLLQPHH